jgi:hypothetical protein
MPITYDNKEDIREVFLPRKNTITAADLNEIKEVVNNLEAMVKAMGGHYANYFNYATGQAPTLADFETQIGFPLINGAKFGDTIVFDNVGYDFSNLSSIYNAVGLIGYLKCSSVDLPDDLFSDNALTHVYIPFAENIGDNVFAANQITHFYAPNWLISSGDTILTDNNLQYFNAPLVQQIGSTTGDNGVFFGNTGNNITAILPSIHQTSNGGGLEGDLQYLDDENTVTFDWDGDEVPDWIKCCSFITL